MTAEIVIMNKEAVALAADSAVSLVTGPAENPQKIFTSANKIFRLSRNHTVAFMIYNNAAFLGIPWEPLITRFGVGDPDISLVRASVCGLEIGGANSGDIESDQRADYFVHLDLCKYVRGDFRSRVAPRVSGPP